MTIQLVDRQTGKVTFDGKRVSRSLPCPVCSHLHTRQGWCVVDAGRGLAICPRVESPKRIGEAGWLHGAQIPTGSFVVRSALREERVDWTQLWAQAVADCTDSDSGEVVRIPWGFCGHGGNRHGGWFVGGGDVGKRRSNMRDKTTHNRRQENVRYGITIGSHHSTDIRQTIA